MDVVVWKFWYGVLVCVFDDGIFVGFLVESSGGVVLGLLCGVWEF